ncbi:MAG TPA: TonB family protein, partial [Candidatus Synoicihabitans sp.]|nr:TonB family protein [Candidatus Synoicihabitans sp.]
HRQLGFESYLAAPGELDQPMRLIRRVGPVMPAEWTHQARETARVIVDFYIDQTGRPRMPMIDESPDSLLSRAALEALLQWEFEPPRRRNLPVIVRVKQEFSFPARAAAENAPVEQAE